MELKRKMHPATTHILAAAGYDSIGADNPQRIISNRCMKAFHSFFSNVERGIRKRLCRCEREKEAVHAPVRLRQAKPIRFKEAYFIPQALKGYTVMVYPFFVFLDF